jgi:hypothetical protein
MSPRTVRSFPKEAPAGRRTDVSGPSTAGGASTSGATTPTQRRLAGKPGGASSSPNGESSRDTVARSTTGAVKSAQSAQSAERLGRGHTGTPPSNRMRRARLKIANIDPWSVMKVSFLFSVAIALMGLVAVTLIWSLLDMMGVFSTVGSTVSDVTGGAGGGGFDVQAFFSLSRVLGFTTIIALVDVVLITALATIAAYLYNVTTDFVGGIEITLAEDE